MLVYGTFYESYFIGLQMTLLRRIVLPKCSVPYTLVVFNGN